MTSTPTPPKPPGIDIASLFCIVAAQHLQSIATGTVIIEHGTAEFSESTLQAMQAAMNKHGNPIAPISVEASRATLNQEAA